jgi:hypothetical protein
MYNNKNMNLNNADWYQNNDTLSKYKIEEWNFVLKLKKKLISVLNTMNPVK